MISRYIFDETMYRICFSETFNVCFFRSAGRLSNRSGAAVISFDGCLLFHFRYSVVDSLMRVYRLYHIERLFVNGLLMLFRFEGQE